ncbi:MAG: conjugative transposon protein TraM [Bacteroidales bacterium]|nr:conjugative transposon protein TraM [Bacteroidales bacterium]
MSNFFKDKKNLYIVAGAGIALVVLVVYIWVKIADFKGARDKQQTIVSDPKITESTRNREYSEVSRESAAGIFAGRDSLRSSSTKEQPAQVEQASSEPVITDHNASLVSALAPAETIPEETTKKPGNRRTNNSARTVPATDTTVKTALEQQLEQIENRTTVTKTKKHEPEQKEEIPKSPLINLTVVKSRKPSVYSTYKEELTTTHDNVVLFSAKVYGFQKIKTNETLTLRNTETITANGHVIAAGSIFRGTAKMSGNRMTVDVTSAVSRDGRYSVKMSVYDNDFVKGIFVKEVSESTEDNVSSATDAAINIATSAVPLGSVVKSVGKETAKQTQRALEKQNKITITLEDGYEVYLALAITNK